MPNNAANQRQVVLVTGDSSGIGRACCAHLAARGFTVYGASRTSPGILTWTHIAMDITNDAAITAAVESVLSRETRIDAVVHCAGASLIGPFEDTTIEEAKQHFDVNYFGAVRVMRSVLPEMRRHRSGKLIIVGSISGVIGLPYLSHYSSTKSALDRMIESIRPELLPFGIEATILHPGDFNTQISSNRKKSAATNEGSAYFDECARFEEFYSDCEAQARGPDILARLIENLLKRQRLPARVIAGTAIERLGVRAKYWLPSRLFEHLLGRIYAP